MSHSHSNIPTLRDRIEPVISDQLTFNKDFFVATLEKLEAIVHNVKAAAEQKVVEFTQEKQKLNDQIVSLQQQLAEKDVLINSLEAIAVTPEEVDNISQQLQGVLNSVNQLNP